MSTRAMARQYSSGGRGGSGWDSLDLFGGKARAANKAADAAAELEVRLQEQLAEIEKQKEIAVKAAEHANQLAIKKAESGARLDEQKQKAIDDKRKSNVDSRNKVAESLGMDPKMYKQLSPQLRLRLENEINASIAAQQIDKSSASKLDPNYAKAVELDTLAQRLKQSTINQQNSKVQVGQGEFATYTPFENPLDGAATVLNPAPSTSETELTSQYNMDTKRTEMVPSRIRTSTPGNVTHRIPVDTSRRLSTAPTELNYGPPLPDGYGNDGTPPAAATGIRVGNNPFGLSPTGINPNYEASAEILPQAKFRGVLPHTLEMLQDLPGFPRRLGQATIDNVIRPSGDFLKYLLMGSGNQQ